jgi:hypothetical protein
MQTLADVVLGSEHTGHGTVTTVMRPTVPGSRRRPASPSRFESARTRAVRTQKSG